MNENLNLVEKLKNDLPILHSMENQNRNNAFRAGVEFAQRWIPIEEDLPAKDDCERCLWKNSGGIWFGTARQSENLLIGD